jgi:hypothetical protein
MQPAAGQFPYEPGIDRTESELAVFGPLAYSRDVVQQPRYLARRKIGVDFESGLLPYHLPMGFSDSAAMVGGAAVLPDDGVVNRLSGGSFPNDRSFPLVR